MNTGEKKRKRARMGAESTPDRKKAVRKSKTTTTRQRTLKDVLNTMAETAAVQSDDATRQKSSNDHENTNSVIMVQKASVTSDAKSGTVNAANHSPISLSRKNITELGVVLTW